MKEVTVLSITTILNGQFAETVSYCLANVALTSVYYFVLGMKKHILLLILILFVGCERTPLKLGTPDRFHTVGGSADFLVDMGRTNGTLFVKVIGEGAEPMLTAVS